MHCIPILIFILLVNAQSCQNCDKLQLTGTLVVANINNNSATVVDLPTGEIISSIPTGAGPHQAILLNTERLEVIFTNYASRPSSLTLVDIANARTTTISLGTFRAPHGLQFVRQVHCLVTVQDSEAIVMVDIRAGQVIQVIPTPGLRCHSIHVSPVNPSVAVCADFYSGNVGVIDLTSNSVVKEIYSGEGAIDIKFTPAGNEIWVTNRDANTIRIIDAVSLTVVQTLSPQGIIRPVRVVFTQDGQFAMVINKDSGNVSIFSVPSRVEIERIALREVFRGEPSEIIVASAQYILIADVANNAVHVMDVFDGFNIVSIIRGFNEPEGLSYSPRRCC